MSTRRLPLSGPPESLFVLRFSALGDVVHVVPLVRSIRAWWPSTRVTWCVGELEHRLVGDLPGVDFVVFDKATGARGLRRALRGRRFDVLVHGQYSLRANLASLAVRAPIRLGWDRARARDLHGLVVNHRVPAGRCEHVVDGYLAFARELGVQRTELRWDLPVPAEARAFADELLGTAGDPVLVVSPCSSHAARNWLPERYAALADRAAEEHGMRVLITGGPTDAERRMGREIETRMRAPVTNLVGRDTLKRLLAILERASLVVTPDSGPMHMATAAGTAVLGLHAASNPHRSGPYLSRRWCVDRYDAAARRFLGRPASELKWGTKIEHAGVMELITVDDAVERLDAFVAAGLPAPPTEVPAGAGKEG